MLCYEQEVEASRVEPFHSAMENVFRGQRLGFVWFPEFLHLLFVGAFKELWHLYHVLIHVIIVLRLILVLQIMF